MKKPFQVLLAASKLSEDGELTCTTGTVVSEPFQSLTKPDELAEKALQKGKLRNPGVTHLVMGMAYFNLQNFNDALSQLAKAEQFDGAKRMAQQWTRYVEAEKTGQQKLQAALSS